MAYEYLYHISMYQKLVIFTDVCMKNFYVCQIIVYTYSVWKEYLLSKTKDGKYIYNKKKICLKCHIYFCHYFKKSLNLF